MNPYDEGLMLPGIEMYASAHTSVELPVLQKLTRFTYLRTHQPQMLSGHLQGVFLQMLSKMISPARILEIGTFTGYSAICLAQGLQPHGKLITIEVNPEMVEFANAFFTEAALQDKIIQLTGDATTILPEIDGLFDLVFIDADKENYISYFNAVLPKVKSGGFILADNALWYGRVIDESAAEDRETAAIASFNSFINNHPAVENMLLPLRDGIMLIRKI